MSWTAAGGRDRVASPTMMHVLLRLVSFALLGAPLIAQQPTEPTPAVAVPMTGFLPKTLSLEGRDHRYVVYVPPGARPDQGWPLLMFLHGMGECGTDGEKQVEVGLGPAIKQDPQRWPFVVVFPQKPDKQSQWSDHDAMVMAMLAATEMDFAIDGKRRFLTGLSQGGAGTWAIGAKHQTVWAAMAPVCGYGLPADVASELVKTPIWAFHGEDDKVVPARQSMALVAAVQAEGGTPVLTIYERTAHNSWDQAYRESALAEWFRLVVGAPAAAACVASRERVSAGALTLACDGSADVDLLAIEWKAGELVWTVQARGAELPSPPRRGKAKAADGNQLLATTVAQLARAGLFDLPPVIRPVVAVGTEVTGKRFVLALTLEGAGGTWRFQRELPPAAASDARYADVVRALLALVDAAAAWR